MSSIRVDDIRLSRVGYFDVPLDPDVIGFTKQQVASVPWAVPAWATSAGQVLVGQAVWVIESDDRTLVVDPCGAADAFLRSGPEAVLHQEAVVAALANEGFAVDRVDAVVLSHLDGIGMSAAVAADGTWTPFFPNAKVLLSANELAHVESNPGIGGAPLLAELVRQGAVEALSPPQPVAPGVTVEQVGGHSPGHLVLRVGDGAVFIGHLAVSPLQLSAGVQPAQHVDAVRAHDALEEELRRARDRHALMIGPLWPSPGAGRVTGPPWILEAVPLSA